MGFGIVTFTKVSEDASCVTYNYEHEGREGRFKIDRTTGEIQPLQEEAGRSAFYAARHKITHAWRAGELPDKAIWAG